MYKKIIIVGVIPTREVLEFEAVNGKITHAFPFEGTDEERVRYTKKVNQKLEELSKIHDFIYFNPYEYYTRENGCLKGEMSDNNSHLGDNTYFLQEFVKLIEICEINLK